LQDEEAIRRLKEKCAGLLELANHGRYDDALARAIDIAREAEACGDPESLRTTAQIRDRLSAMYAAMRHLVQEADALEKAGDFEGACAKIDLLHARHPFWKDARNRLFPLSLEVGVPGVKIYRKDGLHPWPSEPLAVTQARADGTVEPVILRLQYGHGKFQIRFEREGYVTTEVRAADERRGRIRVEMRRE
jgi:hypothetical protein